MTHTALQRIHTYLGVLLTTMGLLILANSLSGLYLDHEEPKVDLQFKELVRFNKHDGEDNYLIQFDLKADLRPCFNWNVKQLFVYVTAEYEIPNRGESKTVVWDHIIKSEEEANLVLVDQPNKYYTTDYSTELRDQKITLKFNWNVMGWNGFLRTKTEGESSFTLPKTYY
ncbi:microsomal signal peptidase 23 kd subunit spc22/23 [Anaeramoeba flamelloides]|uniref:Signal peptidase complex subunit 3 n=1 Tax=Anaeramoeba flamelloides TaxID=1746091 RepID=A0AAV7YWS6_9EUKA|nr:microsomal signal peptidase 23 kd subunit spc22/23 [Anaeramoeba flamelloides]